MMIMMIMRMKMMMMNDELICKVKLWLFVTAAGRTGTGSYWKLVPGWQESSAFAWHCQWPRHTEDWAGYCCRSSRCWNLHIACWTRRLLGCFATEDHLSQYC